MKPPANYLFAPYRLLSQQRQLLSSGEQPVKLGGRAFDVLLALVERSDRTVGKNELMDLVWPRLVVEENNLQVQIMSLRKLLGHAAIATVPGRGYRFTLPVQVEGESAPAAPPVAASQDDRAGRRSNLRLPLAPLIGRDDDQRTLLGLLRQHPLVTIAGAGGIGKTRLAQAVAAAQLEASPDGIWWVDLSALTDAERVADAVAQAMGLGTPGGGDAVAAMWAALQAQAPLLVLDNAEHLLQGVAGFAARVRRDAPRARLLVTTQEVLRVADEHVFRPEPLSLPGGDDPVAIDASAAVALFVARARAANRAFTLDVDNRVAVADICRRLDGIPLAIELAAARASLLGVEGLREKLDQRFHVLTSGHRASLRRHQTLRAALEWSHQLLSAPEQAVLRRLAVFAGGCTLEAAQEIGEGPGIDGWDVLEHLGALVDKSLVVAEGEGVPRYRLLETTRLFALERLIDSGEVHETRGRHREHFMHLAEVSGRRLLFGDARCHMARLDLERDNLLLALAWAPEGDDGIAALRLAAALHHYWTQRAMPGLGVQVTRAVLDRPSAQAPTLARCRALVTAGWLAHFGDGAAALAPLEEALRLARSLADVPALCHALCRLAHVRHNRHEPEAAEPLATEALALARTLGDSVELGDALFVRAHVHISRGQLGPGRALLGQALELRKRIDALSGVVSIHLGLAYLAIDTGTPEEARPHLREALLRLSEIELRSSCVHLMGVVAQWAAVTGRAEASVLLEAACVRQLGLAGMRDELEAEEALRLERAAATLEGGTRRRLESEGRALTFQQALRVVTGLLADPPS